MPPCDLAERETGWRPTVYPNILYLSSLCPLSASIGSIYCRPECARPSGSTVVKCLRTHQCLTSETLLSNLQSDGGRPTSSLGSLDRPPGTARRQYHSSPASPFWTFRTCQVFFFFVHPSSHRLLNTLARLEVLSYPFFRSYMVDSKGFDQRLV